MPNKTVLAALLVAAALGGSTALRQPALAAAVAPADAQTGKIVAAAKAFEATLTDAQKKALNFAFTDSVQRARWSNFPVGMTPRAGVRWGELNAAQRTALTTLLASVLSPEGMTMVKQQMDADDQLKANPGAGGGPVGPGGPNGGPPPGGGTRGGRGPAGPGGGSPNFGADYYYVAFLGAPSATAPWMLQFGGHHLAVNATIVGPNLTLSPSLTGGQPTKYTKDGKAIYIVEKEVHAASAMMAALTADQRKKAVISSERIDLVLGPGHDGQTLQPEGLPASAMTAPQKALLLALVESRLDIINPDDFAAAMADVRKNIGQTWLAWYGPTADAGSAYFRVTGPTLVLEFSPQGLGGDPSNHLHNMYRNPTNDYGAAWASLK